MSDSSKTKTKANAKEKRKRLKTKGQDGQLSCLNAAAKVLAEKGEPMTCKEMIEAMATKGYWTTPGGQTPHATLYSVSRERSATREKSPDSRRANAAGSPAPALRSRFRCPPCQ
jgi:HB1, ASXL, restriction endonuclease HTH domain